MPIVRAPGVTPAGFLGIRGWRPLCSECLWMRLEPVSYDAAHRALAKHHRTCRRHQLK